MIIKLQMHFSLEFHTICDFVREKFLTKHSKIYVSNLRVETSKNLMEVKQMHYARRFPRKQIFVSRVSNESKQPLEIFICIDLVN